MKNHLKSKLKPIAISISKKDKKNLQKPLQEVSKTLQNGRGFGGENDFQHEQGSQRASKTIFELNISPNGLKILT